MEQYIYLLRADFQKEYQEVTRDEFIQAERCAGFRPKAGNGVATGGFGGGGVSGSIRLKSPPKESV